MTELLKQLTGFSAGFLLSNCLGGVGALALSHARAKTEGWRREAVAAQTGKGGCNGRAQHRVSSGNLFASNVYFL